MAEIRLLFLIQVLIFFAGNAARAQEKTTGQTKSAGKRFPRIGIFLPLSHNEDSRLKTENILEYYKGMMAANEYCTSIDSGMNFRLFDHQNSVEELLLLSESGCMNGLDLIVGPIRQNLVPVLDSIANAKDIPLINVLSHSSHTAFSGCMTFQQPSFQAIAATCLLKAEKLGSNQGAGIIYGPERKDSLLAEEYRKLCLEKNLPVKLFLKAEDGKSEKLVQSLSSSGLNSKMHLFVAGNEAQNRVKVFSGYTSSKVRCPVFFYGNWLERSSLDFDELSMMPCYFVAPDLPIPPFDAEWLESFVTRWGNPPSWVAWKGFDLVMMLANHWYGSKKSRFELNSGWQHSELFGRYFFEPGKAENQFVPLYKFDKNGFSMVNP